MKITLSPDARDYAISEASYLRARNPAAAIRFQNDLKRLARHIGRFPEMGAESPEMPVPGVRRLVMGSYLVDYEIKDKVIIILAIRHGRQRPPGLPVDPDFDFEA